MGKSWLSCALGHKACREDLSVLYYRVPRLFAALALARGDGRYGRFGQPAEVADVVLFLCSQASDMICGEIMMVDGGYSAL